MRQEDISFFNTIAPQWDAMECRSVPSRIRHILSVAGIEDGMRVADLGTGTGVLIPYICERIGESGRLTAVDGVEAMLDIAREKYEDEYPDVEFRLCDFEESGLGERFDLIFLYCVYPHLQRPVETLRRLQRESLLPGGRIIIAFPNDEQFVNQVHSDKGSEADCLPSAPALALRLFDHGFRAKVLETTPDTYILQIY